MRVQSIAFIIAMSLGAAVYDPDLMQRMANWLGFSFQLNQDITLRIPPFLTLLMAILTLLTALRMCEPGRQNYQTNAGRGTSIAEGLSFNFAYGVIGVLYSLLLARLRLQVGAAQPDVVSSQLENLVFIKSIAWFPGYFLLTMLAVLVFARWRLKNTDMYKKPG